MSLQLVMNYIKSQKELYKIDEKLPKKYKKM